MGLKLNGQQLAERATQRVIEVAISQAIGGVGGVVEVLLQATARTARRSVGGFALEDAEAIELLQAVLDEATDGQLRKGQTRPADTTVAGLVDRLRKPADDGVHTCSYSCQRPACIKAQRDELAAPWRRTEVSP